MYPLDIVFVLYSLFLNSFIYVFVCVLAYITVSVLLIHLFHLFYLFQRNHTKSDSSLRVKLLQIYIYTSVKSLLKGKSLPHRQDSQLLRSNKLPHWYQVLRRTVRSS